MRVDQIWGKPPDVEGLDEFDAWAESKGFIVWRNYSPDWVDEDGTIGPEGEVYPGFWVTSLGIERRDTEGVMHVRMLDVDEAHIIRGWKQSWEAIGQLVVASFERDIEERGVVLAEL